MELRLAEWKEGHFLLRVSEFVWGKDPPSLLNGELMWKTFS